MEREELLEGIFETLQEKRHTVSFAESCTGGRIASAFTALSGASTILNGSCVTYSNEIKHLWLGVEHDVLDTHGAVSKACVSQMLSGIQKITDSDYAIAVSGIAGPTGGTPEKPVGTVIIGVLTPRKKTIEVCLFEGSRNEVQEKSTQFAIELLYKHLI
jgi:nicotinamide-nucleotide amidase